MGPRSPSLVGISARLSLSPIGSPSSLKERVFSSMWLCFSPRAGLGVRRATKPPPVFLIGPRAPSGFFLKPPPKGGSPARGGLFGTLPRPHFFNKPRPTGFFTPREKLVGLKGFHRGPNLGRAKFLRRGPPPLWVPLLGACPILGFPVNQGQAQGLPYLSRDPGQEKFSFPKALLIIGKRVMRKKFGDPQPPSCCMKIGDWAQHGHLLKGALKN